MTWTLNGELTYACARTSRLLRRDVIRVSYTCIYLFDCLFVVSTLCSNFQFTLDLTRALYTSPPCSLGFNSAGKLKSNVTAKAAAPGVELYTKKMRSGAEAAAAPAVFYVGGGAGAQGKPILPAKKKGAAYKHVSGGAGGRDGRVARPQPSASAAGGAPSA